MKAQFNFFSNNFLNPTISPRYARRYSGDGEELTSPINLINPQSMIKHWERVAKQNNVTPIQSKNVWSEKKKELKSEHKEFKLKRISSTFHLKELKDDDPIDENPLIIVQSPKKEKLQK